MRPAASVIGAKPVSAISMHRNADPQIAPRAISRDVSMAVGWRMGGMSRWLVSRYE